MERRSARLFVLLGVALVQRPAGARPAGRGATAVKSAPSTSTPAASARPAPPDGMVRVAGGVFTMGGERGERDERPTFRAAVSTFFLDRLEVRVADYRRCVQAGRCAAPRKDPGAADLPVTWVRWKDAADYCRFAGKRLPTEAEWEYAARGTDGRLYPWGDPPGGRQFDASDCARANFGNYRGEGRCPENPGHPVAVGSRPSGAGPFGALDQAGNVWEWVADRYGSYARFAREKQPVRDPRGPSGGDRRVLRGGACCSMFGLPRTTDRIAFPPDYADEDIGFRCAKGS